MDSSGNDAERPGHDTPKDATPSDAAARLRDAITALRSGAGSRSELQTAAQALVGELRRANLPPEQMLLQIKAVLSDAGLRASYATPTELDLAVTSDASIYRDVISWSIREYYADT